MLGMHIALTKYPNTICSFNCTLSSINVAGVSKTPNYVIRTAEKYKVKAEAQICDTEYEVG